MPCISEVTVRTIDIVSGPRNNDVQAVRVLDVGTVRDQFLDGIRNLM